MHTGSAEVPQLHHTLAGGASATRAGRVLIVDDESDLLEISVTYLSARGYAALSAEGGNQALALLDKDGPVDVLITDIVMGGAMDGMELAQAVHRLYPHTRIIYSSGFPADALSTRSLPLADSLVLQKPYRLTELGESVDRAIVPVTSARTPSTAPAPNNAST